LRIAVACLSLNTLGGAERLCVRFLRALEKTDWEVTVATIDKTNWMLLEKSLDIHLRPMKEFYLFKTMPELPTLTLQQGFLVLLHVLELFLFSVKGRYDLLANMRGEVVDSFGDIVYFNAMPLKLMHIYPQIQPTQDSKWAIYGRLLSLLTKFFKGSQRIFVANSKFTKYIIERHFRRMAAVVYPPVELKKIRSCPSIGHRENTVVAISRFRLAKELEKIPEIAKLAENCRFVIIGSSDRNSEECLRVISKRARELGVHKRVEIFENMPFDFVLENLFAAKVYLHTQPTEAFGIAIVEAMAAGCVPVVPRDGGPWLDILEQHQGKYGFSYATLEEAADYIRTLLQNEQLRTEISKRAQKRAMNFESSLFEERIQGIVRAVLKAKSKDIGST